MFQHTKKYKIHETDVKNYFKRLALDLRFANNKHINGVKGNGISDNNFTTLFNKTIEYGRNELMNVDRLRPPQSFVIKPTVGKLLVFPSWLQHMVYPYKGEGERRTVASNLNCWDVTEQPTEKGEEDGNDS